MSEEDIQEFMNITLQDRRTAMYCLQRHNGNLNLAISYWFDNSYRIQIPSDFMNENSQSSTSNTRTSENQSQTPNQILSALQSSLQLLSTNRRRRDEAQATTFDNQSANPPPANPPDLTARLTRDLTRYKKSDPSIFIPYGLPISEKPVQFDDHHSKTSNEDMPNFEKLYSCIECKNVRCIVWKDGISLDSKFYPKSDPKCHEAMKQVKKNLLPTALIPNIGMVDLDIDFKSTKYQSEK